MSQPAVGMCCHLLVSDKGKKAIAKKSAKKTTAKILLFEQSLQNISLSFSVFLPP